MNQQDERVSTCKKTTNIKRCENTFEKKKHVCDQCSWSFKRLADLKKHLIVHSDLKPFKCHLCNKSFKRSSDAKDHLIVHSDARPFNCSICDKTFKRLPSLKLHENTAHYKKTEKVPSKKRSRTLSVRPEKAHVTSLKVQNDLNVSTSRKQDSAKSRYCHLRKGSRMFENEKFSYIEEVEDALKLLYSLSENKQIIFDATNHKSEECNKSSESPKLKELASKRLDSSETRSGAFERRKTMSMRSSESVENKKPYKCSQCSFIFKQFRLLKTHMHIAHAGQKHYACGHCNRRFKKSRSLKEHVKSVSEIEQQKSGKFCNGKNGLRVTLMQAYNSELKISFNPTKYGKKENNDGFNKGDQLIFKTDSFNNDHSIDKTHFKKWSLTVTATTPKMDQEQKSFHGQGHPEKEDFFNKDNISKVDENSDEYLWNSLNEETMFGSKDWQALIDETIGEDNIDEYLRLELFPAFPLE